MKLQVDFTSDIHLDHYMHDPVSLSNFFSIFKGGDILLIAGDVSARHPGGRRKATQFFTDVSSKYKWVVYVKGNHDFYESIKKPPYADSHYCPELENVILLNRKTIELDGLKISGCFAWYETGAPMNDIYYIPNAIEYSKIQKSLDLDFLSQIEKTDILMTHTPLSYQAIAPKFQGNEFNKYYYHDREDLIVKSSPQLYLSGHTHSELEYNVINNSKLNTLCVSHAAGYKGEIKPRYTPRRFIFENSTLQLQVPE